MQNKNCHILESYRVPMRKLRTFCGKVTEFLFLVFKQSVSNSRDFGFQKYIWSDITDPLYIPLKIRLSERRRSLFVLPSVRILSKAGRTSLSAFWEPSWRVCYLYFYTIMPCVSCMEIRRWIWFLLLVEVTWNRCPINFK